MPDVRLEGLRKSYGDIKAADGLDWRSRTASTSAC